MRIGYRTGPKDPPPKDDDSRSAPNARHKKRKSAQKQRKNGPYPSPSSAPGIVLTYSSKIRADWSTAFRVTYSSA